MAIKFSNLASTTLASGVSDTATSLSVTSASSFPSLGGSDYFYASIGRGSGSEIVKVTALSGTTLTVVRGQDDTTAISHASGVEFALRVTAASLNDLSTQADTESVSIAGDTMTGALTVPALDITGNTTTSGTIDGRDVAADGTKLDGIESGATADQTASEIKAAYESNSDTNAFTDADESKLGGIESGATADQTASEIKTAYESNSDTNAFTDAAESKLSGIEASADVTDTTNVTAAGALMDSEVTNLTQVKAFDSSDYATAAQGTTADDALPKSGGAMTGAITTNSTFDGRDVATDGTKLDGIEANATADQTNAEIRAAVEAASDSNAFTDADHSKLNAIEAGATADQTAAEIKTAYESNSDTNAFTDADHSKLNGIAANANNYVLPSGYATESYVNTQVTNLIDSSPATLNTLNELAAALGDDPNFATTTANSIGTKAALSGAAFTGAITTNSTIDGRDVATDGTKLDGIEASADVTDTANVTAAGALMDSEVTNLAQVKAFDSADYATAAQGTTADAALPKSGGAMTGAITTNSTFDGRDVATDGTKLDGIEASADVTDTTNVTAAGALMDSELTAIASVKGLDQGVATTDSPSFVNLALSGTGSVKVPSGTTAQRDGSPVNGMFRYNSSNQQFEGYQSGDWGAIGGGGGSNTFTADTFTADGSTTAYALSQVINSENNLLVFIDGVFQQQSAYSIATASGTTTLTFSTAPANTREIIVYSVASAVSGSNLNTDSMTGDGSDVTLALSIAPVSENNTQVFIDGVYQNKDTYSISGTTLTFSTAPPTGSAVEVMTMTQTEVNVPVDGTITSAKLSGDLTLPGDLNFADNSKAIFGAGSDLQIYHDGSSRIANSTGNLIISDTDGDIYIQAKAGENSIKANNDGSVLVYFDNAEKLATTSTGIDVTGTVVADGIESSGNFAFTAADGMQISAKETVGINIDSDDNDSSRAFTVTSGSSGSLETLIIASEDAGVTLYHDNSPKLATTSTGIDVTGAVNSDTLDVTGSTGTIARFRDSGNGIIDIKTTGTANSDPMQIDVNNRSLAFATNNTERMRITSSGDILGKTADVRIGSDVGSVEYGTSTANSVRFYSSDTERMRITSAGYVGIGASSPTTSLDLASTNFGLPPTSGTTPNAFMRVGYTDRTWTGSEMLFGIVNAHPDYAGFVQMKMPTDYSTNRAFSINPQGGNVGIGTSSPVTTLTVSNTTQNDALGIAQVVNTTANDASNSSMTVKNHSGTGQFMQWEHYGMRVGNRITTNNGVGEVVFTQGNDVEKMRLTANGLGIGTSSPVNNTNKTTLGLQGAWGGQLDIMVGSTVHAQFGTDNFSSGQSCRIQSQDGIVFKAGGSTERMRIDSSGNITAMTSGTAMKAPLLQATNANVATYTGTTPTLLSPSSGTLAFSMAGGERMRIDSSGNLLVGTTSQASASAGGFSVNPSGYINSSRPTTSTAGHHQFFNPNGLCGVITTTGTTTTYATSSDQRLKENITDADDAGSKVDAIQVRQYDWKVDGSHQDYGMIAQELLEVAPDAVSQGETEEDMMGVDYSKLVPMLIKEIQSLRNRVARLEE